MSRCFGDCVAALLMLAIVAAPLLQEQGEQADAREEGKKKTKKEKDPDALEWVVAPIPVVEPNLGNGLGAIGLILTPLNKKDKVSNKSMLGAGGFYTNTGS